MSRNTINYEIDFDEFLNSMMLDVNCINTISNISDTYLTPTTLKKISSTQKTKIENLFNNFDQHKTGQITFKSLKYILNNEFNENLTDNDINKMINVVDIKNDGIIDFDEFCVFMTDIVS